jgi:hypothetical protein
MRFNLKNSDKNLPLKNSVRKCCNCGFFFLLLDFCGTSSFII